MCCKVSVIVPVYNVEKYLSKCIESITNQTLDDIEIICVNDGSTDSSKNILENFQKTDKRIVVINKANEGYGAACNNGLKLAKGEFISIIEADDFIDEKMLENLYNLACSNKADVVKSAYYEYSEKDDNTTNIQKINWSQIYDMPKSVVKIEKCPQFLYFHPSIWSCLYSKQFLRENNITFIEAKKAGWADNPFQVQTLCLAQRLVYTDEAYYFYRLTNPTSSSSIVNINNPFDRSEEVHKFLDENRIENKDLLAHLYKRELGYIDIVLACISPDMFDYASEKIIKMLNRMKKEIIYKNKHITDYEKSFFENCLFKDGIKEMMNKIKNGTAHLATSAIIE